MSNKPYASALNKAPHLLQLVDEINSRFDFLHQQVKENRVYLIDEVTASALYFLAQQFNVLGYKGWILAEGENERRELIKRAIELHRYKGTPWSVKEAIRSLGFNHVTLIERVGLISNYYDGTITHNGSEQYGGEATGEWATFSVFINASDWSEAITGDYLTALLALIGEYKNVRSHLVELGLQLHFEDSMEMLDDDSMGNDVDFEDELDMTLNYDGTATYGGVYDHDLTADSMSLVIEEPTTTVMEFAAYAGGQEISINFTGATGKVINWGDGTNTTITGDGDYAHTYATVGEARTVSIQSDGIVSIQVGTLTGTILTSITGIPESLTQLYILNHQALSLDLSAMVNLQKLQIDGGPIQAIILPESVNGVVDSIEILNGEIPVTHLNDLLILIDSWGTSNGQFDSRGQTPAASPFGDAINAIVALYDRSWTVLYDF